MSIKIEKKITGYEVAKPEDEVAKKESNVASIAPLLERDEILVGQTYKSKPRIPNMLCISPSMM